MGLIRVTNDLSQAPSNTAGSWKSMKTNAETAMKKFMFWVFIIILIVVIIKLIMWIYKHAMRKYLNNQIGLYTGLLQSSQDAAPYSNQYAPPYAYAQPYAQPQYPQPQYQYPQPQYQYPQPYAQPQYPQPYAQPQYS
jgi:hypothetical protein